jgi:hypothetical protein
MASFDSQTQSIPNTTATKIVSSDNFDRLVYIRQSVDTKMAFTSAGASTGAAVSVVGGSFVLPAREELWVYHSYGSTQPVEFVVTAK